MNASVSRAIASLMIAGFLAGCATAQHTPKANAPVSAVPAESSPGPNYKRALELYAKGPSAAKEILDALELEIAANPTFINAYVLKARTLKGVNQCKQALRALDQANRVASAQSRISGDAQLLRAECLYYERQFTEAQRVLEVFASVMPDTPEAKHKYEWLQQQLAERIDNAPKTAPVTPGAAPPPSQ
jgi:tetratricopeptide (TPR) repeat protein